MLSVHWTAAIDVLETTPTNTGSTIAFEKKKKKSKCLLSGYFIRLLIASTEPRLSSAIIIAKLRFSLCCRGPRYRFLSPSIDGSCGTSEIKCCSGGPTAARRNGESGGGVEEDNHSTGSEVRQPGWSIRTKTRQGRQRFRRLPSTSTYSKLRAFGQTPAAISKQLSPFNYYSRECCTPVKPPQEHILCLLFLLKKKRKKKKNFIDPTVGKFATVEF